MALSSTTRATTSTSSSLARRRACPPFSAKSATPATSLPARNGQLTPLEALSSSANGDSRYTSGARECYTHLYVPGEGGARFLLGPATIIWNTPTPSPPPPNDHLVFERTVLVRLHPAICASAFEAFNDAKSNLNCSVRRCEKEFLTIEVTGRRATEVVKAVLKPVLASSQAAKEVSWVRRFARRVVADFVAGLEEVELDCWTWQCSQGDDIWP